MHYAVKRFCSNRFETNTYLVSGYHSDDDSKPACRFLVDPDGDKKEVKNYLRFLLPCCDGIICTHGHFDHIRALPYLSRVLPTVPIFCGRDDLCFFGEEAAEIHIDDFWPFGMSGFVENFIMTEGPIPRPNRILKDGDTLPFAPEWKIFHTPGHSPGSICIYNANANTVFSGDLIFDDGCLGKTDSLGGDYDQLLKSVAWIGTLPHGTKVLPGHGEYFYL